MADGLPKMRDARPVDFVDLFIIGGLERMTHMVNSGEAISGEMLADCERLARRVQALLDAIERRRVMQNGKRSEAGVNW